MNNLSSKNQTRRSRQGGFTLVEVIVVLSVILLLTGIAIPMLMSYMEDGRRARAESECKTLGSAVMSFYKDVGYWPSRNASSVDHYLYVLMSGTAQPTVNPYLASHGWITWGMSTDRGDIFDNHLLVNTPKATAGAAYLQTGNLRWRGPYIAGSYTLDPWGRPYVCNVIAGHSVHATNYKRVFVLSAGQDGIINTGANATATTDIGGDDIAVMLSQRQ